MSKLSVIVTIGCIGAVIVGSGPALPAPQYTGRGAFGPGTGFEDRYFGRRNVGYVGGARVGHLRPGRTRRVGNQARGGLWHLGGTVFAYSASPSYRRGMRHLGGTVFGYSGLPSYGVLRSAGGAASGYFGTPLYNGHSRGLPYYGPRDPNAGTRHFNRGRHNGMLPPSRLNTGAWSGFRHVR